MRMHEEIVAKDIQSGLFDTFGTGMIQDSRVVLTHRFPSLADASITEMVRSLTSSEEEQLAKSSRQRREDIFDRFNKVERQVLENSKVTDSNMLAFTVCSACGSTLRVVKNRTIRRLFSKSATAGFVCVNEKCSFYVKLIPENRVSELTNVAFIQQVTVATENFLKEHPEYRRK